MSLFSEEQLKELEQIFDLKRKKTIQVRDGFVELNDTVWWRCKDGPSEVKVSDDIDNIRRYPQHYQIAQPTTKIEYLD
jgi:hypothetical protein